MLDEVEDSLRDMFDRASERAKTVPANLAHVVGEVAAEDWYARFVPKDAAGKMLWLRATLAVMPLIPLSRTARASQNPSGYRAIEGACHIIGVMIRQGLCQHESEPVAVHRDAPSAASGNSAPAS